MNRKKLALVIAAASGTIFIWFLLSLSGTSSLTITAAEKTPDNAQISVRVTRDTDVEEEFSLAPGQSKSLRLKKGMVRVDSEAGNLKGVDVVEVGKTKELVTPAGQQHAISKLGANAVFCPIIVGDTVFSYSCFGDGRVVQHTNVAQSKTLFKDQIFGELHPLKNGLIGFYPDNFTKMLYLDLSSNTIQPVTLPAAVQTAMNKEFPQITVASDPGASYVALTFVDANQIFIMKDLTDAAPVEIKPTITLKEAGRQFTPSLTANEFILYTGNEKGDHTDGTEVTKTIESNLSAAIFEYDLNGKLTKTIHMPEGFGTLGGMYKIADNYYGAEQESVIDFYYVTGDDLKQIYRLNDIASWIRIDKNVYVQTNGVLYHFVPGEQGLFGLHSVFSSTDLDVSQVFSSTKGLLFTAYVNGGIDSPLNIYQLLDTVVDPDTPIAPSEKTPTRFSNFQTLLDYGISADQVQGLEEATKEYLDIKGEAVELASIANIAIVAAPRGSVGVKDNATFDLVLDDTTYKAKVEYSGLTDVRLFIFSSSGSTVFDSGAQ